MPRHRNESPRHRGIAENARGDRRGLADVGRTVREQAREDFRGALVADPPGGQSGPRANRGVGRGGGRLERGGFEGPAILSATSAGSASTSEATAPASACREPWEAGVGASAGADAGRDFGGTQPMLEPAATDTITAPSAPRARCIARLSKSKIGPGL